MDTLRVIERAPARPAVLFLHGFGVDRETHMKEAESLADAGFAAARSPRSAPPSSSRA